MFPNVPGAGEAVAGVPVRQASIIDIIEAKGLSLDASIKESMKGNSYIQEQNLTPFRDDITMDSFQSQRLIDAIFRNLLNRQVNFTEETWCRITNLCSGDFDDVHSRIRLQMLFTITKMDPAELSRDDRRYKKVVACYAWDLIELDKKIELAYDEKTEEMKILLSKPLFTKALRMCLAEVGLIYDKEKTNAVLEAMKIYVAFNWISDIRGICLQDGILVNAFQAPGISNDSQSGRCKAELITLLLHEFVHFLVRKLTNNYNFNSPSPGISVDLRPDPDQSNRPGKLLELGRNIDLIIFGFQPDWASPETSLSSAAKFFEILDNADQDLPLK